MSDDEDWDKDFADSEDLVIGGGNIKLKLQLDESNSSGGKGGGDSIGSGATSSPGSSSGRQPVDKMLFRPPSDNNMKSLKTSPSKENIASTSTPDMKEILRNKLAPPGSPNILSVPSTPTRKLSIPEDDEDWDKDFEDDTSDLDTAKPTIKITGIKADPNQKEEDWDDDFDFGEADKGNNQ
jgi:hypothetical protein